MPESLRRRKRLLAATAHLAVSARLGERPRHRARRRRRRPLLQRDVQILTPACTRCTCFGRRADHTASRIDRDTQGWRVEAGPAVGRAEPLRDPTPGSRPSSRASVVVLSDRMRRPSEPPRGPAGAMRSLRCGATRFAGAATPRGRDRGHREAERRPQYVASEATSRIQGEPRPHGPGQPRLNQRSLRGREAEGFLALPPRRRTSHPPDRSPALESIK
jgi:hypothetical protein